LAFSLEGEQEDAALERLCSVRHRVRRVAWAFEEALAGVVDEQYDHQPVVVDQVVSDQSLSQRGAGGEEDVLARLALQL
jgi:hypothetical protein